MDSFVDPVHKNINPWTEGMTQLTFTAGNLVAGGAGHGGGEVVYSDRGNLN